MNTITNSDPIREKKIIDVVIKLLLVILLAGWCIMIILPFLSVVLWGVILAITLFPLYKRLTAFLKGRKTLASSVIIGLLLIVMIIPTIWLIISIIEEAKWLVDGFQNNTLKIPQPNPEVASWPVIGKPLFKAWEMLVTNMAEAITTYKDPILEMGKKFLGSLLGVGSNFIMFIVSLIISGFLLVRNETSEQSALAFSNHMVGSKGAEFLEIAIQTVRNVAKGILGVAFIQFILSGVVFLLADIPLAGFWAFLVLILAIIQLPTSIIAIPVIIYMYTIKDPLPATLWAVVILLIGLSDNFLKPYLMGKGSKLPLLVIFLGAIGGFIFSGFMGLFTGAIVLSLGYKLAGIWLSDEKTETKEIPVIVSETNEKPE